MAKQLTGTTDKRKGAGAWVVVQWLWGNLFGLALAVAVFGVLPGLQIVTGGGNKTYQVREVTALTEPPPPDTVEEEPPPPEEAEEEPPPPIPQPQMSLAQAMSNIGPVGGGGAAMMQPLGGGIMDQMMSGIGGEIDQKPQAITRVAPRLPSTLGRQRLVGSVDVEFVVDAQGRVQSPRVVRSFNTLLNEHVLKAIRQWRFKPASRGGKPVPMKTRMPFKFDS